MIPILTYLNQFSLQFINIIYMGGSESKSDYGYRVIEVLEDSPADEAKLIPFLDFIVSINGTNLSESEMPFQEIIKRNVNCKVNLEVYNLVSDSMREITVTPKQ